MRVVIQKSDHTSPTVFLEVNSTELSLLCAFLPTPRAPEAEHPPELISEQVAKLQQQLLQAYLELTK
jgi:hypothetical protein